MQCNGMRLNGVREPLRVERRWKPKEGPGRGTRATYVGNTRAWRTSASSVAGLKEATERRFLIFEERIFTSVGVFGM